MTTPAKLSEADLAQIHRQRMLVSSRAEPDHPFHRRREVRRHQEAALSGLRRNRSSQRSQIRVAEQPFQVWKLTVNADHTGTITGGRQL